MGENGSASFRYFRTSRSIGTMLARMLRCVMTTHAQQDLPRDLAIFRTAVERHQANLGAFTSIEGDGRVHLGAPVYLVK